MNKIKDQLTKIESLLTEIERENLNVSKASVGWHLEHCLLIINSSLKGLANTNPKDYNPKFSFKKLFFLGFRIIPRGKVRAPKQFFPLEKSSQENLTNLINKAKIRLADTNNLPDKSFITHPFLGDFDKKTTLKFLEIHTNHHLKIIADILKNR